MFTAGKKHGGNTVQHRALLLRRVTLQRMKRDTAPADGFLQARTVADHCIHMFRDKAPVIGTKIFMGAEELIDDTVGWPAFMHNKIIEFRGMADKR